jgi:TPR repeat protein
MSEPELEHLIEKTNSDAGRFILGRLLVEGSSEKIARNVTKGVNWLKEAVKNGNIDAIEYKVYFDIRFDKQPRIQKILAHLEQVVDKTKSARACNTLGEFNHF